MIKHGKKVCAIVCAVLSSMFMFTGCHGSEGLRAFEIPEEFDTTRQYEIVFWAKNDTNKAQTNVYEQAILDFEASIQELPSIIPSNEPSAISRP